MSRTNFNQLCNMLHSTMTKPHLLSLPYDVRRLIYEYYFPVNKHIHLTSGPLSMKTIPEGSIGSRLSLEATSLMRVCKQVSLETTPILYATNTFFMVANETLQAQSYWISSRWLHNLRIPTRQMVKKLELLVRVPLKRSLMIGLSSGVAHFPHLEVRFKGTTFWIMEDAELLWKKLWDREMLEQENQMIALCKGVMRARGAQQTVWIDSKFSTVSAYRKTGILKDSKALLDSRRHGLVLDRHGSKKKYGLIVDGGDWNRRDKEGSLEYINPPWRL